MSMLSGSNSKPFILTKYQNRNEDSKAYGKWFQRGLIISTLETKDIAEHMVEHGSIYSADVIEGVLSQFYRCAAEQVFQNRRVKMTGLGTLYLSVQSKPADEPSKATPEKIASARIKLLPDASEAAQLTGAKLRQRIKFTHTMNSSMYNDAMEIKDSDEEQGDIENP